jgi:hypothetical protein
VEGSRAPGLGKRGASCLRRTDGGQTIRLNDHTECKRRAPSMQPSSVSRTAIVSSARCSYSTGPLPRGLLLVALIGDSRSVQRHPLAFRLCTNIQSGCPTRTIGYAGFFSTTTRPAALRKTW